MNAKWCVAGWIILPIFAQNQVPVRVGVGVIQRQLSLGEAIELALRNNAELEVERINLATAEQQLVGAHAFLDTRLRWAPRLENRNIPTSSTLIGVDGKLVEKVHAENFYLDQRLPWQGMALSLAFENTRQSTTNPFVSLNPYLTSSLGVNLNLPLLRNRKIDRERANVRVSARQVEISELALELRVIDIVRRTAEAYWDLVAARRGAEVAADAVRLARDQLERTRRMIDSGTVAPVELAAAQAELERRIDTWYSAIGAVTQLENALKLLIAESRHDPIWNDEIVPTSVDMLDPSIEAELPKAIQVALARRRELKQLGEQKAIAEIQKELAQDQLKPQINLVAGYMISGLAGVMVDRQNPFAELSRLQIERLNELSRMAGLAPLPPVTGFGRVPEHLRGGYGTALSTVFEGRFPTLYAGLQLEWFARNRAAEAQLVQSNLAQRRLEVQTRQLEQLIEAQVRNALQALEVTRQRIQAAEASVRAAKEKLDSEIRLFQTGESTNFMVLTRQNEYADSQRRLLAAQSDYNKAVVQLEQAVGTLLDRFGVQVAWRP